MFIVCFMAAPRHGKGDLGLTKGGSVLRVTLLLCFRCFLVHLRSLLVNKVCGVL